jgi:hypothetical protein
VSVFQLGHWETTGIGAHCVDFTAQIKEKRQGERMGEVV